MKKIKFAEHLVAPILSGEKTVTWRLSDDKNLTEGDVVGFVNAGSGEQFGVARIVSVREKRLCDIEDADYDGHERYASVDEMVWTFRGYYGDGVDEQCMVKIVGFVVLMRVAGCVIVRDDALLLLHRTKRGWWETPGGKIEDGESEHATVAREASEEIGCAVEVGDKLCEDTFEVDGYDMYASWYRCELRGDARIGEPERFDDIAWIPIASLSDYALSPAVRVLHPHLADLR